MISDTCGRTEFQNGKKPALAKGKTRASQRRRKRVTTTPHSPHH
jgi:hypothetical protein